MMQTTVTYAPWCQERWSTLIAALQIPRDLRDMAQAFVRRSTTLSVWTVQGKLKGTGGREDFSITVPIIGRGIWHKQIIPAIARRPGLLAQVLVGIIPAEIEDVFAEIGTSLFPEEFTSLACTCCSYSPRLCKHMIAALIQAAEVFWRDPLSLIELRGIKRAELLRLLNEAHQATLMHPGAEPDAAYALPTDPQQFWQGLPWPETLPELAEPSGLFIWYLKEPDFAVGTSLENTFAYAYQAARDATRNRR